MCREDKKLIDAHIIPKSFYNFSGREIGPFKVISNSSGQYPKRAPIGLYDSSILCESCDKDFGKLDQFAAENLLNATDTEDWEHNGEVVARIYPSAVSDAITKFAFSMLLRAAWSTQPFFKRVSLGPFQKELENYCRNDEETPLSFDLCIAEYDYHDVPMMDPHKTRFDGVNFWYFTANRFEFYLKVDQRPVGASLSNTSLCNLGRTVSVVRSWNESKQREVMRTISAEVIEKYGPLWPRR